MTEKPFHFSKTFLQERCDFCGRCFNECPALELPLEQAQNEIKNLVERGDSEILNRCVGCMACNSICPTDSNPHTLILNSWGKRYSKTGLPSRAKLVLPYQKPNLYSLMQERLPEDEQALTRVWEENYRNPPKAETMVYAGCNLILQPFLVGDRIFKGIPIFGSADLCCGEPLYRSGCWDAAKAAAAHVKREFSRLGFRRVITPCPAGWHLFSHVYPEVLDAPLDCEIVSLEQWILERIERGELTLSPLGKRAVIHDNCWPKASGSAMFDAMRRLLQKLGVEVIDPEHTRDRALCCGMCAGAARFKMQDILAVAKKRLAELDKVEADFIVDYCGGCNWLLALADVFSLRKIRKPLFHLLEVVRMATGEKVEQKVHKRAALIASTMKGPLAKSYLSRKREWITEIARVEIQREQSKG
jgi:Fe-S oxidoreductase